MRNRWRRFVTLAGVPFVPAVRALFVAALLVALATACSGGGGGDADAAADAAADTSPPADAAADASSPDVASECASAADCAGRFPQAGPCQVAACHPDGTCALEAVEDGEACDDDLACTQISACVGGACVGTGAPDCDDDNPCTDDACVEPGGCANVARTGVACDDGDPCTDGDACDAAGVCVSGAYACEPCVADADCTPFEDGDACNGTLACVAGVCKADPSTRVVCDTSNDPPCQETRCVPNTGACERDAVADGNACEDGNACTQGDTCGGGVCAQGPYVCPACETAADCAEYAPENACLGRVACVASECRIDPATVVVCAATGDPCAVAYCDAADGSCKTRGVADGTLCDDGDPCTAGDRCAAGVCGGTARDCDDGDACTEEACSPETGECVVSAAVACDDEDACTTDACDPATGACVVTATVACDDEDACTTDACDPATGECVYDAVGCVEAGVDCANQLDDDEDGLVDCEDPDCAADAFCLGGAVCEAPSVLGFGTFGGTTVLGGDAYGPTGCPQALAAEHVWAFAVDAPTVVCIDTVGSRYDTVLYLRADGCAEGVEVGCSDDIIPGMLQSQVEFEAAPGTPYFVFVDGFREDSVGPYTLHVTAGPCPEREICADGLDNDGDDLVDCADPDCESDPFCGGTGEICDLPGDEDGNGLADCEDPACFGVPPCGFPQPELCDVPGDEDGNGLADCEDPACVEAPACVEEAVCAATVPIACGDTVQTNNADGVAAIGRYDCAIFEETGPELAYELVVEAPQTVQVSLTGLSADLDVFVLEGDCVNRACVAHSATIADERVTFEAVPGVSYFLVVDGYQGATSDFALQVRCGRFERVCDDGADDDEDGATDCADDDCAEAPFCGDFETCDDGIDNDGDGVLDCDDGRCLTHPACTFVGTCEAAASLACGDVVEGSTVGDANDLLRYACGRSAESGPEVVYAFTAPIPVAKITSAQAVVLRVESLTEGYDPDLFVLGPDCATDACVGAGVADGADAVGFGAGLGAVYYVVVDARAMGEGDFRLTVDCDATFEWGCDDGIDEDGDGVTDCDDGDCAGAPVCQAWYEDCGNGVDDNGDGAVDCQDLACVLAPGCFGQTEYCDDGFDNDGDARVDCADLDCTEAPACTGPFTCAQPGPLPTGEIVEGSTLGLPDAVEPACTRTGTGPDAFWSWAAPAAGVWCIDTRGSAIDTVLAVRQSCDGEDLACNDDVAGAPGEPSRREARVEFTAEADGTYLVIVAGFGVDAGDYTLTVSEGPCPVLFEGDCADEVDEDADGATDCADDDCARAPACVTAVCEPVATAVCGDVVLGSTIDAANLVDQYLFPCAPDLTGPEVAYTFVADRDDVLRLRLDAGEVPLLALVLDGVCAPETCLGGGPFEPAVDVLAGHTYVLVVDGPGDAAADFVLTVSCESQDESLNCGDGVDNDGDEQVDCDDVDDCGTAPTCFESSCADGVDNEGDGLTDCDDDECAEARVCTGGLSCAVPGELAVPGRVVDTTDGLSDAVEPDCVAAGTGADAVYAWTAAEDGVLCLHTGGSDMDTVLFVREDCLNGPDIACDDDTPPLGSGSILDLDVVAGTTYFVVVGRFGSGEGAFVLNAFDGPCPPFFEDVCDDQIDEDLDGETDCADPDCADAPTCFESDCADGVDNEGDGRTDCADDECAAAPECYEAACDNSVDDDTDGFTDCDDPDCELAFVCADGGFTCALPAVLAVPGRTSGSTTGAPDNADPVCQTNTGADVVFAWTPETDEVLCIDTNGSSFDTVLYVRLDCENGPEIACDDDGGDGLQSQLELTQTPGVPHYLYVDGWGTTSGTYTVTTTPGPCP